MTLLWLGFVLLNLGRLSDAPVGEMPSPLVAAEQRVHTKGCLFAQNFSWVMEKVVLGGDFCLCSHCSWSCAGGWRWQLPHHAARAPGLIAFSFFPQPSKPSPVLPAEVLIYARKPEGSILEVSACFQIQPVLISCTAGCLAVPRQEQDRRLHRPKASSCSSGSHKTALAPVF